MISVITPTYNRADLISETIKSIINQSYKDWELILVDDGSTDNTAEVIKPFLKEDNRINYVERPKDRPGGGNAARNYGFELAKGEYIKWLDSDDLLDPCCLSKQLNKIMEDDSDVVFCRSQYFTKENGGIKIGKPWHPRFPGSSENGLRDFVLGKFRFSNNAGLWRKKCIKSTPFDVELKNSQEYLMIISVLSTTNKVSFLPDFLVKIRRHPDQMPFKRSYASYAKNQCLSRFKALQIVRRSQYYTPKLKTFLIKSMIFYIRNQIKLREFQNLKKNLNLLFRSITI